MGRAFILFGFALYFLNLCLTGDLQKFINMRYAYMMYFAIFALLVLAFAQFWRARNPEKGAAACSCGLDHEHVNGHGHEHQHAYEHGNGHEHQHGRQHAHKHEHDHPHSHNEEKTDWKKTAVYAIFILPLFTGFIFPVATLNSFTATNKGINFPVKDGTTWEKYNQILQPDTSLYYGQDSYNQRMAKNLQMMQSQSLLSVNDTNYFNILETLYKNEKLFQGKEIVFSGFAFQDKNLPSSQPFLLRYGLVHCILDSGVYGLKLSLPAGVTMKTDGWYQVKGVIAEDYYAPVQGVIPTINVTEVQHIPQPADPYVYFNYNS